MCVPRIKGQFVDERRGPRGSFGCTSETRSAFSAPRYGWLDLRTRSERKIQAQERGRRNAFRSRNAAAAMRPGRLGSLAAGCGAAARSRCERSPCKLPPDVFALFLLALGLARGAVVLDERVDLRADDDHEAGDVEPEHQDDDRPDRAVGGAVVAEVADVDGEGERRRDQQHDAKHGTGRDEPELLLDIGREAVDQRERQEQGEDDHDPPEHPERDHDDLVLADEIEEPVLHHAPEHDEREATDHERHEGHAEHERDRARLEEAPPLLDVVGDVELLHDRVHAGRDRPERDQDPDREQAPALLLRHLRHRPSRSCAASCGRASCSRSMMA
jgi:hypothetical protein